VSDTVTPRQQDWLLGHEEAEATLRRAAETGRLHHAWLLTGPAGIGKETLAFRFARWLLAGRPAGRLLDVSPHDPVFRRVAAGTHADLLTVRREFDQKRQRFRGEIVLDDVRPVSDFLRRTAAEGGWRVVIVDGADLLNRNAANALLKILEEPPPRAVLLLTASAPGRLLPTIRSRCRSLRLVPLGEMQMQRALERLLPDLEPEQRHHLGRLADGAPGRALAFAEDDGLVLERLVRDLVSAGGSTSGDAYRVAELVLKRESGFSTFLTLLSDAISEDVRQAARNQHDAAGLSAGCNVWQQIRHVQDETERFNLDKRQALLSSLSLLSGR